MRPMTTSLAEWVVAQRESRGWTQAQLADRAGVRRSDLNAIEHGRIALPGAEKRRKLAAALGLRHVDVLVGAGELTAEEAGPPLVPTYPDDRLRAIAENWNAITDVEQQMMMLVVNDNRRRRGLSDLDDLVVNVNATPHQNAAASGGD